MPAVAKFGFPPPFPPAKAAISFTSFPACKFFEITSSQADTIKIAFSFSTFENMITKLLDLSFIWSHKVFKNSVDSLEYFLIIILVPFISLQELKSSFTSKFAILAKSLSIFLSFVMEFFYQS